jgi:putative peptidoglycan lipid II flippase
MTSQALVFFGYGVVAFALVKILSNFFFARDNTKTPFYISSFIVFLNVIISLTFFNQIGFLIVPLATSISTWVGVIIFLYVLRKKNYLILGNNLFNNTIKIVLSTIFMVLFLLILLEKYSNYLDYEYTFKSIYLLIIVGFAVIVYLILCYLLGLLNIKNYKTN